MNLLILHEDARVRVYKNTSGEILVENVNACDGNPTVRVTPHNNGFYVTSHNGILTPWAILGLPAFLVGRS